MINRQRVWAVMRKDWRELARNKQAVAPLVIIPLMLAVLLPAAIIILGNNAVLASSINGLQGFLDHLPDRVVPATYSTAQTVVYAVIVYFMAPFFLIIPVMVASITGSSSFVGEKERRTIEGLLYTPITDRELVLAKVLVSVIPSVLLSWVSFVVYTVLVNALGAPLMGGLFFPTWTWAILIVALVPLLAFLATCLIVAMSGRSTTVQDAQGSAVLIILPVVALVVGQATGLLLFDVSIALLASAALLVIDVAVFAATAGRFQRERIITRL
ncbi:ABC transporter permease subunit [Pengzhenrongella frigida]|uniref:ABC transporter permease n=1 Tax=Pengzhenrongella frigida TaxID=1259133 RepID=A0A4Q5MZA3_9MICO|nr:ABC transporter permease subunit [Cellulomonas sp. HLT2-17]RYV49567.1 ABC transporter permease [Cellulomonas sp. HLT2-17]